MQVTINDSALGRLIERVVRHVLAEVEKERDAFGDKLVLSEAEAASALGVRQHVLRDERARGRIHCSRIVGRRIRYRPKDLAEYLERERE